MKALIAAGSVLKLWYSDSKGIVRNKMANKTSKDVTFFNGVLNNPMDKGKILITAKLEKKSLGHNMEKKTRKSISSDKENSAEPPVRKSTRTSNKPEREVLKVVNAPAKVSASPSAKKKNDVGSSTRKSVAKADPIPSQVNQVKKVNQGAPKIIVYKDDTCKTKQQEGKKTRASLLSKSWDGSNPSDIKKGSDKGEKSAGSKKVRNSMNDLCSIRTPGEKNKEVALAEDIKNPAKQKPRFSQFKPEDPEFEEMTLKLETLFPNTDPEFIKSVFVKLKGCLPETIELIMRMEKSEKLPTRVDYLRRLEAEKLRNRFMDNFCIESFVKMIPDPWEYFLKTERHKCVNYFEHSFHYLKNKYKKHYTKTIEHALKKNDYSLYLADKELKKSKQTKMRLTNRSKNECNARSPNTFDIQFMHEVAFIEHERKIKSYINKAVKLKKLKEAEQAESLLECQSCCKSSLLQDDTVNCPANHVFCKECVVEYVELEMVKDNFQFKCLRKCKERFSLEFLQAALSPPMMVKIVQRHHLEEHKSERVDDLVWCPFCFHVTALSAEVKVLNCPNPSCRLDSCRECKQFNHTPFECDEVEKFNITILEEEGEIEEQREKDLPLCIHCNGEFLKQEDSNQMICLCGATICSICHQPFPECQHADSESNAHRLSFSSDYSDIFAAVEDDLEGSSTCSDDSTEFQPTESSAF